MLVCNVSLRPQRSAIAADLAEAAVAGDLVTRSIGFGVLLDEPASASDTLTAFIGHIMAEAASAGDAFNAGLIYAVAIDEPASAVDASEAIFAGGIFADVVETATAIDDPSATVSGAPSDDPWTLVNSWTHSGDVAQVDFTGLAGYTEVRVVVRSLSATATGTRTLRVSIDNGSTFKTASGDYIEVNASGNENNLAHILLNTASGTAASSGEIKISGWNLTTNKTVEYGNRTDIHCALIPTTSALNALRIYNGISGSVSGNLSGGSIYVFAR